MGIPYMESVSSSNISSVSYDFWESTLYVEFFSGCMYRYYSSKIIICRRHFKSAV